MTRHCFVKAVLAVAAFAVATGFASASRVNEEPIGCAKIALSDAGAPEATAATTVVLKALGYKPSVKALSPGDTLMSLKSGDVDVFLGGWLPALDKDIAPFHQDGSIETVKINLKGASAHYGTNSGKEQAQTNVRKGFAEACHNVGKLLKNQSFSLDLVKYVTTHADNPEGAAAAWLKANPEVLKRWLKGVTTFDLKDGLKAVRRTLGK